MRRWFDETDEIGQRVDPMMSSQMEVEDLLPFAGVDDGLAPLMDEGARQLSMKL